MIFKSHAAIEFESRFVPFIHFQMNRVDAKFMRFRFQIFHGVEAEATTAIFRQNVQFVDERIRSKKLETETEREDNIADQLSINDEHPQATAIRMNKQETKCFADGDFTK